MERRACTILISLTNTHRWWKKMMPKKKETGLILRKKLPKVIQNKRPLESTGNHREMIDFVIRHFIINTDTFIKKSIESTGNQKRNDFSSFYDKETSIKYRNFDAKICSITLDKIWPWPMPVFEGYYPKVKVTWRSRLLHLLIFLLDATSKTARNQDANDLKCENKQTQGCC